MSSILDSIPSGGDSGGGLPPDIMAAISAGGGQEDPAPADDTSGDPNASAADLLAQALDLLQQYMGVEPDESDKATVATCIANLQKVRAKDQQEADGALQGKTTPRLIRKAMAGQGADGGSGY